VNRTSVLLPIPPNTHGEIEEFLGNLEFIAKALPQSMLVLSSYTTLSFRCTPLDVPKNSVITVRHC